MLSKRCFTGSVHALMDLETGFNVIRERTAVLNTNKDGEQFLFVAGWTDWDAAALYLLVQSGVKGNMLTEKIVAAKARELYAAGQPLRPEWLGTVMMSDKGSEAPVEPEELEERATVGGEAPESPTAGSGVAESTFYNPNQHLPEGAEPVPAFDPTLPPGGNMPRREYPMDAIPGLKEVLLDNQDLSYSPELIRAAEEATLGFDRHGRPEARLDLGAPGAPGAVPPEERSRILLEAPSATISLTFSGEVWKTIKLLSLLWGTAPEKVVMRLVGERYEHYGRPEVMNRLLRGEGNPFSGDDDEPE